MVTEVRGNGFLTLPLTEQQHTTVHLTLRDNTEVCGHTINSVLISWGNWNGDRWEGADDVLGAAIGLLHADGADVCFWWRNIAIWKANKSGIESNRIQSMGCIQVRWARSIGYNILLVCAIWKAREKEGNTSHIQTTKVQNCILVDAFTITIRGYLSEYPWHEGKKTHQTTANSYRPLHFYGMDVIIYIFTSVGSSTQTPNTYQTMASLCGLLAPFVSCLPLGIRVKLIPNTIQKVDCCLAASYQRLHNRAG